MEIPPAAFDELTAHADPGPAPVPEAPAVPPELESSAAPRRLLTIPALLGGAAAVWALSPLLLPLAAVTDMLRRLPGTERSCLTRFLLGFMFYLSAEVVAIAALAAVWLWPDLDGRARQRRIVRATHWLQDRFIAFVLAGLMRIFSLRLEIEGEECISPGPLLVFPRHSSLLDTLLPSRIFKHRHGVHLCFILKRELLWDPAVDVGSNRLPNYFVGRGGSDTQRDLAGVSRLAAGLGPGEGLLLYPEGTRFTPEKRERALAKLQTIHPELVERAKQLRHLLPPRTGGPLAVLEAAPQADVVFMAHHGLEVAAKFTDFSNGRLLGRTIRVKLWRVRRSEIPSGHDARIQWLYDHWHAMDEWIASAGGA